MLNMGPAAGLGLVGFFRAWNFAYTGNAALRPDGDPTDVHPADLVRGFLAVEVVRLLSFSRARNWSDAIAREVERDIPNRDVRLGTHIVPVRVARASAELVANVLACDVFVTLENHQLRDIQNWHDDDEETIDIVRRALLQIRPLPTMIGSGFYAAHVVAAAVTAAAAGDGPLDLLFERMIRLLKEMHDANPAWGPLYVTHRGNLYRHRFYTVHERTVAAPTLAEAEAQTSPATRRPAARRPAGKRPAAAEDEADRAAPARSGQSSRSGRARADAARAGRSGRTAGKRAGRRQR
jgi:hypothetical protein